jgi:hypothetical protein
MALILSAGLLVTLSACSASGVNSSCTPLAQDGKSTETITATGALFGTPQVDFGIPINPTETQRKVLIEGSGAPAQPNDVVLATFTLLNGSTAEVAQHSPYLASLTDEGAPAGVRDALVCAKPGDRIAAAVPPSQLSVGGAAADDANAASGPSGVFIFDIKDTFPGKATGADQVPIAGLPSVVTTDIGRPGITIPSGPAPSDLKFSTLKKGDGQVVNAGDALVVQYTGVVWSTRSVFDSTWQSGSAKNILLADIATTKSGVVPGLVTALEGQTVGSQVIASIPAAQAFGDAGNGTVAGGATVVYVVDILGVIPAE